MKRRQIWPYLICLFGLLVLLTACGGGDSPGNGGNGGDPSVSSFSASPNSGTAPLDVTFNWSLSVPAGTTETVSCDLTTGDGTAVISLTDCASATSQTHTYSTTGTFTARLSVGSSSRTATVTVSDAPTEDAPELVGFVDEQSRNVIVILTGSSLKRQGQGFNVNVQSASGQAPIRGKNAAMLGRMLQQDNGDTRGTRGLVDFAGKSVVAVTAAGQVVADSPIDELGRFAVPAPMNMADSVLSLVIAELRDDIWICLAPLQYDRSGEVQPVLIDLPDGGWQDALNIGEFGFNNQGELSQDATRLRDDSIVVPLRSAPAGFQDGSFIDCGQEPERLTVSGDLNWRGRILSGNDGVAEGSIYANTVALLLEPAATTEEDEFIAATSLDAQGRFSRTIRSDATRSGDVSVVLTDTALFDETSEVRFPLHPTFNLAQFAGLPVNTTDFGEVPLGLAFREGTVTDERGNPIPDALVYIVLDSNDILAYNIALTNRNGQYRILVPTSTTPYTFVAEAYDPVQDDFVFATRTSTGSTGYVVNDANSLRGEDFVLTLADTTDSPTVTIEDSALEEAIRDELDKFEGDLTEADLRRLRFLDASLADISDLSGLENAVNLEELLLYDNEISDLSPIETLLNLSELDLAGNRISDLGPLVRNVQAGGLGAGDAIFVEDNDLDLEDGSDDRADIELILDAGADCFYGLDESDLLADATPITLPEALEGSLEATDSTIYSVPVDIYTIAASETSRGINVQLTTNVDSYVFVLTEEGDFVTEGDRNVRFASQSGLGYAIVVSATDEDTLGAYRLSVEEVANEPAQLADPNLAEAIADEVGKSVSELTKVDLESLVFLDASYYEIDSISGLEAAVNLINLDLSGNNFSDLSPLPFLKSLETLNLESNGDINDLRPLADLTNLITLGLGDNSIVNLQPLAGLDNLEVLSLYSNFLEDISPLASLASLSVLDLEYNFISDLTPLLQSSLADGDELYVNGNFLNGASISALEVLRNRGVFVSFDDLTEDVPSLTDIQLLRSGEEVSGSLAEDDDVFNDESFADYYLVRSDQDQNLYLELASDFEGVLLVIADGGIVEFADIPNDDGVLILETEVNADTIYVVVVTSFSFEDGDYTLFAELFEDEPAD
ncbi:MAG: leucine-rich repeat domain-containing protein [Deinococcota bacterium]